MPVELVEIILKDMDIQASKPAKDCRAPRGPLLDTYIRMVAHSGEIIWECEELDFEPALAIPFLDGDLSVEQELATNPNLTTLLQGSVILLVHYLDANGKMTAALGNGALLSEKLVLTAGHLLELQIGERLSRIEVYNQAGACVVAVPKPIPDDSISDIPDEAQSTIDNIFIKNVDIAILELIDPVSSDFGKPFKLPQSGWQVPALEPIAMCGFPGDGPRMTGGPARNLIPSSLRKSIIETFALNHHDLDHLSEKLYHISIKTTKNRIVAF